MAAVLAVLSTGCVKVVKIGEEGALTGKVEFNASDSVSGLWEEAKANSEGKAVELPAFLEEAGGDMSVLDILVELYFEQVIREFSKFGSKFIGHPNNKLPGIEMNSGSLGHGLPISVGMALAAKLDGRSYRVYTVLGDGELAEGSVWEGVMAAHQYRLDNLCAVVDRNRLQISGCTEDVMAQDDQMQRWAAFGWHVIRAKGNDYGELKAAFEEAKRVKGAPSVIIADTVKGYGSPVMENKAEWHHKVPTAEEYAQIMKDFATRKEAALYE